MRTDVKVGLVCLLGLILVCVAYFAYHAGPEKKTNDTVVNTSSDGTPAPVASGAGSSSPVATTTTAPASAPQTPIASGSPGSPLFGPRSAYGQGAPDNTYTGPTIAPPGTPASPTSTPALITGPGSSTSLVPPTTGPAGGPSLSGTPSGFPSSTPMTGGPTSILPPSPSPLSPASPSHGTIEPGTPSHRTGTIDVPTPGLDTPTFGGTPSFSGDATTHKVEKGDMLSSIAKKYNTTVKAIQAANPGINPNNLKVGSTLKIPAPGASTGSTGTSTSSLTGTITGSTSTGSHSATTHPAKTGKTSAGVRRHHPAGSVAPVSTSTDAPASAGTSTAGGSTYTVKKGDTLGKIAKAVLGDEKAWRSIYNANHDKLSSPDDIKVGEVLKIPAK